MSALLSTLRGKFNIDADRLRLVQKLIIVLGVILLSAIIAPRLPRNRVIALIAGFVGIGAIPIFLRYSQSWVPMMVAASIAVPFSISATAYTSINAGMLAVMGIGGLWVVDMVVVKRKIFLVKSRVNLPLIALSVVSILAFLNGQLPWYYFANPAPITAQLGGLAVILFSVFAFFVVANNLKEIRWLEYATWIFLFLAEFIFLSQLFPLLGQFVNSELQSGVVGGSLFWVWLISLSSSQALFNHKLKKHWRIILGGLILVFIFTNLTQRYTWKSGLIPPLVALGAVVWFGIPKFRLPIIFSGFVIIFFYYADLSSFVTGDETYSISTRFEAWRLVLEVVKVNPILGLGPANYYWFTPLFPILGWSVTFNSHNNYIDLIAQIGILGLACFIWFAWEIFRSGWHLLPNVPEGFSKAYVIGAMGGLIGTLVAGMFGDWFLPFVYNVGFKGFRASIIGWIFLGGLIALQRIHSPQVSKD